MSSSFDPQSIADRMGDGSKRITPDVLNLLRSSIVEQMPDAKIVGPSNDGSFRILHGKRTLEIRETRDDRIGVWGVNGMLGVYDDAYKALGCAVDYFTKSRTRWDQIPQ